MTETAETNPTGSVHIELTAEIVAAYVGHNWVPAEQLPSLLRRVHGAIASLGQPELEKADDKPLVPAVPIKKSISDDYIVCLENGKRFKSLKRHLAAEHGMTPAEYRARWGLPADYPMVAPAYAKARSELAKGMGLGSQRRTDPAKSSTAAA